MWSFISDYLLFLFLIAALAGFILIIYRSKRLAILSSFFSDPAQRAIMRVLISLIGALVFGLWGAIARDNRIFFLASISTELIIYYCLSWFRLITEGTRGRIISRPIAFCLLGLTWLFEVTTFVLAGQNEFTNLAMANPIELVKNNWLWLGGTATLVYTLGGWVVFLIELRHGLKVISGDNKLTLRFRCFWLFITAIFSVGYFATDLIRDLAHKLSGAENPSKELLDLRTLMVILTLIAFVGQIALAKLLFMLYQKLYDQKMRGYLPDVLWLYKRVSNYSDIVFLPEPELEDKYDKPKKPTLVLANLADGLDSFGSLVWKAEAFRHSISTNRPLDRMGNKTERMKLGKEVNVWWHYLENENNTSLLEEVARKYISLEVVPTRKEAIVEERAYYYAKLSKRLQKLCAMCLLLNKTEKDEKRDCNG